MNKKKTALITGITGQDGAYLAKNLISSGYDVIGLIRNSQNVNDFGLKYLDINSKVKLYRCNLLDFNEVVNAIKIIKPEFIFNLAAQSSVKNSFEYPLSTFNFNTISVLNLLEAIKLINKNIKFYQASSSEMYGKVEKLPVDEKTTIHPLSPYAISKASAHWLTVNYREAYGIFASCGILFNHESFLRQENFFVKKVIKEAIAISSGQKDKLVVGNIDVKRDFGHAPEYTKAMKLILEQQSPEDFIICSGKSISLKEIIYHVFDYFNISKTKIEISPDLYRPTEIENIYGDNSKAKEKLNWKYNYDFTSVLNLLIKEELDFSQKILEVDPCR